MSDSGTDVTLRAADYTLEDERQALADAFTSFFQKSSPADRVRAAEPLGFDADLWRELGGLRAVAMGVAEEAGGDGAGLVELVLAAEPFGRHLAPVPLVEATVAARLLASVAPDDDWLPAVLSGERLVTLALHAARPGTPQLVPAGAVADGVVGLVDDALVVATRGDDPPPVANQGHAPIARWSLGAEGVDARPLASGAGAVAAFGQARREWHLLMASALVGMAAATLDLGVDHARDRIAFGVPIGSFQAVAHPLVDVATAVEGARRLVRKAAWFEDVEPHARPELVPMAYRQAEHAAQLGARVAVHVLGGVGFTVESDAQLYFRRAKGWTLVAGDPEARLDDVADHLYGPRATTTPTGGDA